MPINTRVRSISFVRGRSTRDDESINSIVLKRRVFGCAVPTRPGQMDILCDPWAGVDLREVNPPTHSFT